MAIDALKILTDLGANFTFRERPIPIPYDMRSDYRMALILMMLHFCGRKKQAPLAKLHVLNWSNRTNEGRQALLDRLSGSLHLYDVPLKYDPAFNRAVDLARGEGFIERTSSQILAMTPRGEEWLKDLIFSDDFISEKSFLEAVGKRLTNSVMNSILKPSTIW